MYYGFVQKYCSGWGDYLGREEEEEEEGLLVKW